MNVKDTLLALLSGPKEEEFATQRETNSSLLKAKNLELKMNRLISSDLLGEYGSAYFGQGLSFAELRDYQPGDDPRLIHWNVSARFGKPYVKVFHEERQLRVVILLDISSSMIAEGRYSDALEFATLLLSASKMKRDQIGLAKFSNEIHSFIPPGGSRTHYRKTLLALHEPSKLGRETDLTPTLRALHPLLPSRSAVFILSDFESPPFSHELKLLSHSHFVTAVYFPGSFKALQSISAPLRIKNAEGDEEEIVSLKGSEEEEKLEHEMNEHWEELRRSLEEDGANAIRYENSPSFTLRKMAKLKRRKRR